jgi:hypothetical protein
MLLLPLLPPSCAAAAAEDPDSSRLGPRLAAVLVAPL